jgi:hypothetical protein
MRKSDMGAEEPKRSSVFISYSHEDVVWLERLRVHLTPLVRENKIEIWDDTKITPGAKWHEEIKKALAHAKVAVLLVSADFLASDFIATDELPPLLLAAEDEGATILPLILSPSGFLTTESLAQFKAINDPERPLIDLSKGEQERILVKLTEAIRGHLGIAPPVRPPAIAAAPSPSEPGLIHGTVKPKPEGRRASQGMLTAVLVAIIGGIPAVMVGYWQFVYKPDHEIIQYTGRVVDAETQQLIKDARVSVESPGRQVDSAVSNGIFHFELPRSVGSARIKVAATDHESAVIDGPLSGTSIQEIPLKPTKTKYTCQVIDDKTGGQLRDAKVNVETKEGTQVHPLDSEAKFYLNLPSSTNTVHVKIEASGHKDFDEPVTLEAGTNYVRIKPQPGQPKPPDGLSAEDRASLERIRKGAKSKPSASPTPSPSSGSEIERSRTKE